MLTRYNNGQGVYPAHGYPQSFDTVATGNSNGSSEPWGNSTDPSSENSSIDRMHAMNHKMEDPYRGPIMEDGSAYPYPQGPQAGYVKGPPPPTHGGPVKPLLQQQQQQQQPSHTMQQPQQQRQQYFSQQQPPPQQASQQRNKLQSNRNVIKLGESQGGATASDGSFQAQRPALQRAPSSEKKKGWFKKRFGKE